MTTTKENLASHDWSSGQVKVRSDDLATWYGSVGAFSYCQYIENGVWVYYRFFSCRDGLQHAIGKRTRLLYHSGGLKSSKQVADFVGLVEQHLKLKIRSRFGHTNYPSLMWIKVSPWWANSPIRRSFLTALIRGGLQYDPSKELLDNVLSCEYLSETPEAVRRFMNGYTRVKLRKGYSDKHIGWHRTFYRGVEIPPSVYKKLGIKIGEIIHRPVPSNILDLILVN